MYDNVAASRAEVLEIVHQDIEHVAADIRGENAELAARLREEAEEKQALVHRENEAAAAAAARAIAIAEDLRFELREEQANYAASLQRDVVDPLRLEFVGALATRDAQIEALKQEVATRPSVGESEQVKRDDLDRNTRDVVDLKAKVKLMERRTTDAVARIRTIHPPISGSVPQELQGPLPSMSNQSSYAGHVRRLAGVFGTSTVMSQPLPTGLPPGPPVSQVRALAPTDAQALGSLPTLPPFPTDAADCTSFLHCC